LKKADFIISYDISNSKRLRKLAKELEKFAIRIQYSVFYVPSVSQEMLFDIIETINEIIDTNEDDVRIYTVLDPGFKLGQAVDLSDPTTFS
jgi:CRISPR-associated protein Cas2